MLVFVMLLALFMYLAPQVFLQPFIYTTFLSTLPPLFLLATGLTFVIGAGEIDLAFPAIIAFSASFSPVLFKEYELGWLAVAAGLARAFSSASSMECGGEDRHPLLHGDPRQRNSSGPAWQPCFPGGQSYALRGASESSVWRWIVGRPFSGLRGDLDWPTSSVSPVDRSHRDLASGSS
jgi:simple sugar transport system permease protein